MKVAKQILSVFLIMISAALASSMMIIASTGGGEVLTKSLMAIGATAALVIGHKLAN